MIITLIMMSNIGNFLDMSIKISMVLLICEEYELLAIGAFPFSLLRLEVLWFVKFLVSFWKPSPSLIEGCLPMV
jgi:hypothetical protein